MIGRLRVLGMALALLAGPVFFLGTAQSATLASAHSYSGFDKDDYPGNDLLAALRRNFAFTHAPVWQYAQSPRRKSDTAACRRTYADDGRCCEPCLPHSEATHIDLDLSGSSDPSHGR